jgi:hypothetical protein
LADEQASYFSGINHPEVSFLPPEIPFVPAQTSKVAGYISSLYPEESFIAAYGAFGYSLAGLRQATGLPLNDLDLAQVTMRIDRDGVFARGQSNVSLHPSLTTGGSVLVETLVGIERPEDTYVGMNGTLQVAGVGLNPAVAEVDSDGLFVSGDFDSSSLVSQNPHRTGGRHTGAASLRSWTCFCVRILSLPPSTTTATLPLRWPYLPLFANFSRQISIDKLAINA